MKTGALEVNEKGVAVLRQHYQPITAAAPEQRPVISNK
jgi:hypothetical protein